MPNRKKPKVYITRRLPDAVETRMRELFDAELNVTDEARTQPELVSAMRSADVLVPTVTDRIDSALIEQAGPQMKLIANFGNGVDNIDVEAAQKKGITVTNTPNVLSEDTADMTMALMLAVPQGGYTAYVPTEVGEPYPGMKGDFFGGAFSFRVCFR